jgi:hypothetical protein
LKYAKESITDYNVEIEFDKEIKNGVRVYELKNGKMYYVTTLECDSNNPKKFCDSNIKTKEISLRAYIFDL